MGKAKFLLLFVVIDLILIGLSYAMAAQSGFLNNSLVNATFIEFVPDECKVYDKSPGISSSIEFKRNELGDIIDRKSIGLVTEGGYEGSHSDFRIAALNIGDIPLTVDEYRLEIDSGDSYLAKALYFSGKIQIYNKGDNYYDLLGEFKNVSLSKLADNLTSIMKYRKIDIGEKLVIELTQQIVKDSDVKGSEPHDEKGGLQYRLMPVFTQYYPNMDDEINETDAEG